MRKCRDCIYYKPVKEPNIKNGPHTKDKGVCIKNKVVIEAENYCAGGGKPKEE